MKRSLAASNLFRLAFALIVPIAHAQIAPSELVAPKMEISDGNLIFTIQPSVSGRNYQLQWSNSMAGGTWTDVGVVRSGDGSNIVISTPYVVGVQKRFYRVALIVAPVAPDGFALISAGSFQMGNALAASGDGISDELPVHTVNVSAFYMAKHEVTWSQWYWVVRDASGYHDLPLGSAKAHNHPVQSINWYQMVKWCNARSEKEGLTPCYTVSGATYKTGNSAPDCNWSANGYRLPTEAEWEKAARGGYVGLRFPWGDNINHSYANYYNTSYFYESPQNQYYHPTYNDGVKPYFSPVGSFAPNGYGLYDMAGNVEEACWDRWSNSYYTSSPDTDPRGPASGGGWVARGGEWEGRPDKCRVAARYVLSTSFLEGQGAGFRVARSTAPAGFSLIPPGPFTMGDSFGEGVADERPTRTVTLSAFYMGQNEVTKEEWDSVRTWAVSNGYTDLAAGASKPSHHPVQTVTWWDVIKWCNARSEKEGLTPCYTVGGSPMKTGTTEPTVNWAANGYRLPTEAEWEKAARGGLSGKRFPWGDTISHTQANFRNNGGETYQTGTTGHHPLFSTGSEPYTSPSWHFSVFAANGYGLRDMAGNVAEWCWDWYGTYASGAQTDPRGAASGSTRVFRGGSWGTIATGCRTAERFNSGSPDNSNNLMGFRVARSSVP